MLVGCDAIVTRVRCVQVGLDIDPELEVEAEGYYNEGAGTDNPVIHSLEQDLGPLVTTLRRPIFGWTITLLSQFLLAHVLAHKSCLSQA